MSNRVFILFSLSVMMFSTIVQERSKRIKNKIGKMDPEELDYIIEGLNEIVGG